MDDQQRWERTAENTARLIDDAKADVDVSTGRPRPAVPRRTIRRANESLSPHGGRGLFRGLAKRSVQMA